MSFDRKAWLGWCTVGLVLIALGLCIYLTAYVWRRVDRPQSAADVAVVMNKGDFSYFYAAAKAMREGEDIYTVEAVGRNRAGYIYPPLIAFLYQPLASLDINSAARVSLLINIAAMAGALAFAARALLKRLTTRTDAPTLLAVAVFAAILSFDKIRGEIQMLQTNTLVALAMAFALFTLDKKRAGYLWAGAALGFAINIKYQALALLFYLIFRRRWKTVTASLVWTILWGFLPALTVGFAREADYLARGFSGVLRLVGFESAANVANVEPLSNGMSISIPSAIARFLNHFDATHMNPMVLAALVGIAWLFILWGLYRINHTPAILWPKASAQAAHPWRALVGMEWIAVIATVLAFSPQTNSRHMVLTAFVMLLALVLLLEVPPRKRWVPLVAIFLLWAGLNLPPGSRDARNVQSTAVSFWHGISGPSWSLLAATGLLLWTGLRTFMRVPARPAPSNPSPALSARVWTARRLSGHNGLGYRSKNMTKRGGFALVILSAALMAACSNAHPVAHEQPSPEQMRDALKDLMAQKPDASLPEFDLSLAHSPAIRDGKIVRIGSFECDPEELLFTATFTAPTLPLHEVEGRFELDPRHHWRARLIRTRIVSARTPKARYDWYPSDAFSWSRGANRP